MRELIGRRDLLRSASAGALFYLTPSFAQNPETAAGTDLIVRQKEPANLEAPPADLRTFITPTEQFYVRNHFKRPDVGADSWQLKVEGAVRRPLGIGYRELTSMPSRKLVCLLECAGNGRFFLAPKENGVQWQLGAVGTAEWTGVPLAAVLEKTGIGPNAVDVVFEGADEGEINTDPKTPGEIHFARSVPVLKARSADVLLAYKINGSNLSPDHGFPVRLIVPGWYGMASVKWLTRIVVTDKPFEGFFQTLQYSHWERPDGAPTLVPVTGIHVKSSIVAPAVDEIVPQGAAYKVRGLAWAGESNIAVVEFSGDGGSTWNKAGFTGPAVRYAWRLWEYDWKPPSAGQYSLMARATDDQGRTQPMVRDRDHRNYEITHVVPVRVEVR